MSPKMQVDVMAWTTPNFVRLKMPPGQRQDGWNDAPGIPLGEINADVLSMLCDDFRAEVFKKAGKVDPQARAMQSERE